MFCFRLTVLIVDLEKLFSFMFRGEELLIKKSNLSIYRYIQTHVTQVIQVTLLALLPPTKKLKKCKKKKGKKSLKIKK